MLSGNHMASRTKTRNTTPVVKLEGLMSTTPSTQNGVVDPPVESSQVPSTPQDGETEKPAIRNPFFRGLKPEYIRNPFPLDFANNMSSDVFCYAKLVRSIIKPMELTDKQEYMQFIEKAWKYFEEETKREAKLQAREMIQDLINDPHLFNAFADEWNNRVPKLKAA